MKHSKTAPQALTIVGPGRVGQSMAKAAIRAGIEVDLIGRGFDPEGLASRIVLICVPDTMITEVATRIAEAGNLPRLVGHTSGATTLAPLHDCQTGGAFSLHPLQTVPTGETDLTGCPAAVAGTTPDALDLTESLASAAGMKPFKVAEPDRAIYHAAASIASNYLVTLEQTAAELFGSIGIEDPREVLAPLVRRSLDNWQDQGAAALTGPIVRGDEITVESHRAALAADHPDVLPLYDAMAERTRAMVAGKVTAS